MVPVPLAGSTSAPVTCAPCNAVVLNGYLKWNRCALAKPIQQMSDSKRGVCKPDVKTYKSISARWARDRNLKSWFDNMGPAEMQNWYRQKQSGPTGQKRKFDECNYQEGSTQSSYTDAGEIDNWIPWEVSAAEAQDSWHDGDAGRA